MMQKVIQIGSSAGVIIPKKTLEELSVSIGDEVNVVIEPRVHADREFYEWTKKFIDTYRPALRALAEK